MGKPTPCLKPSRSCEKYLRLGFEEVMNPVIIEEEEVKKQFGKEALAVLDRCYYLAEIVNKKPLPIRLFSVDRCFRREQREDEIRLRNYHSASCVFCSDDISIEEGKSITTGLLSQFGFEKLRFREDEKRSK